MFVFLCRRGAPLHRCFTMVRPCFVTSPLFCTEGNEPWTWARTQMYVAVLWLLPSVAASIFQVFKCRQLSPDDARSSTDSTYL